MQALLEAVPMLDTHSSAPALVLEVVEAVAAIGRTGNDPVLHSAVAVGVDFHAHLQLHAEAAGYGQLGVYEKLDDAAGYGRENLAAAGCTGRFVDSADAELGHAGYGELAADSGYGNLPENDYGELHQQATEYTVELAIHRLRKKKLQENPYVIAAGEELAAGNQEELQGKACKNHKNEDYAADLQCNKNLPPRGNPV